MIRTKEKGLVKQEEKLTSGNRPDGRGKRKKNLKLSSLVWTTLIFSYIFFENLHINRIQEQKNNTLCKFEEQWPLTLWIKL